jgi:hypothetical protein
MDAPPLEDPPPRRTADLLTFICRLSFVIPEGNLRFASQPSVFCLAGPDPARAALPITRISLHSDNAPTPRLENNAMSFGIYAIGYFILIVGVAYLAHLMHVPQAYIIALSIILFGAGIVTGVQKTRSKDPR